MRDMSDQTVLSEREVFERLRDRPLWRLIEGRLHRSFQAKNFSAAMSFIVAVGTISDHSHHHPDIHLTNYRNVDIVLSTPRVGGITHMDFRMAAHFDAVPVAYSLTWAHAHPGIRITYIPPTFYITLI